MSQPAADHLTRTTYTTTLLVFQDARRVQADLVTAIAERESLFLDRDGIEFLARRALKLIDACIDAEQANL